MSEQLSFDLTANTKPLVDSTAQGFKTVEEQVRNLKSGIDKTFAKPIQMRMDLDAAQAIADLEKLEQAKAKVALQDKKTERSIALQKRFGKSVKVSAQQLLKSRDAMEKLSQSTAKGSKQAKLLANKIKDINARLARMKAIDATGKLNTGLQGLVGKFTLAGTAANLLTTAIMRIAQAPFAFGAMAVEMEQLQLGLQAFTGSVGNAEIAFSRFTEIAAKTPFNLEQVANAGKTMMAFGMDVESSIVATERLGVVAGATGGDLNSMARNLGQISAQGQAYTRDLTQFAIQGIPIWGEMSKITGKTVSELKKMASEGQISFGLVAQAIANMTAEGTNFSYVAKEMENTFVGKMRQIESAVQKMSLSFIQAINNLDSALGGSIKGSFDNLKNAIDGVAANMDTIIAAIGGLAAAAGVYGAVQATVFIIGLGKKVVLAVAAAIGAFKLLVATYGGLVAVMLIVVKVKTVLMSLLNPAGILLAFAAVATGVAVYNNLKNSMKEAAQAAKEKGNIVEESMNQSKAASASLGMTYDELREKTKGTAETAITQLQAHEDELVAVQQQVAGLKEKYAGLKEELEKAFEVRKDSLQAAINDTKGVIQNLEEQRKALDRLSPAEQKLKDLRKEELEYTARTGREMRAQLSPRAQAKLEAQAALDAMTRQEKQARLQVQIEKEKKQLAKDEAEMRRLTKEHQKEIKQLAVEQKEEAKTLNGIVSGLQTTIQDLGEIIKNAMKDGFSKSSEEAGKIGPKTRGAILPTAALAKQSERLANGFNAANVELDRMAVKIRNMPKLPNAPANAFAGGPVSAGETRTVNELGKEAFLSASGKLSMIKAPAWGEWTAPSKGTIIPAHLTKQLEVPAGGINLNSSPSSNAARAAGTAKAGRIAKAAAGDVFNQNVTVQAANPAQAANNIMVEMTRLRRRRFG